MKMPMAFFGHGNPMNALEPENVFNRTIGEIGANLPKPEAVLMISAHWYSSELEVSSGRHPPMVYDFYGFPEELSQVRYPAPGSPKLALQIQAMLSEHVGLNGERGFDHGAWTVLKYLFPRADVPVVQLSIKSRQTPDWHIRLAGQLAALREQGVMIIGSGNVVHNLGAMSRRHLHTVGAAYDWAVDFQTRINQAVLNKDIDTLARYAELGEAAKLSVPTDEHYLPLLYVMAMCADADTLSLFNDTYVAGSLSMTSVLVQ